MKLSWILSLAIVSAAAPVALSQSTGAELVVQATAFESNGGNAKIILLNDPSAWQELMKGKSADRASWQSRAAMAESPIQSGVAAAHFTQVPPGEYAVMVFHDENGNRELDRSMTGMPKERVGVSNDYRISGFPPRKPTWEDVKFTVHPGMNQKSLEMGLLSNVRR